MTDCIATPVDHHSAAAINVERAKEYDQYRLDRSRNASSSRSIRAGQIAPATSIQSNAPRNYHRPARSVESISQLELLRHNGRSRATPNRASPAAASVDSRLQVAVLLCNQPAFAVHYVETTTDCVSLPIERLDRNQARSRLGQSLHRVNCAARTRHSR